MVYQKRYSKIVAIIKWLLKRPKTKLKTKHGFWSFQAHCHTLAAG